jgi:hypothetical protein
MLGVRPILFLELSRELGAQCPPVLRGVEMKLCRFLLLLLLAGPASAEVLFDHTAIRLWSSDSDWSPGGGLYVAVERILQVPADAQITRFEFGVTSFTSNYPPCVIELRLPWYPDNPLNWGIVRLGDNCPRALITVGLTTEVLPGPWAFVHLVGLTSQGTWTQPVLAAAGFQAPDGVLLHFDGLLDFRVYGELATVGVESRSWSAVRGLYR